MSVSDFSQPGGNASPCSESPSHRKQDKIVMCPWTTEDDIKVGELVIQYERTLIVCTAIRYCFNGGNRYGTKSWSALAAHLPGRTGKQIRERWHNQASRSTPGFITAFS